MCTITTRRRLSVLAAPLAVVATLFAPGTVPAAEVPTPGADGLGDRLYPTLGNGGYDVLHYDLALRYATRLNSLSALAITKLDVLSGLDRIRVCTSYCGGDGAVFEDFPYHQTVLHHTTAQLTELRGWREDLGECRSLSDLPAGAREYLQFISEQVGAPIALVGVGPGREQVIWTDAGRDTLLADGLSQAAVPDGGARAQAPAPSLGTQAADPQGV